MSAAIHWGGPALAGGAVCLGLAVVLISRQPVIGQEISRGAAALLLLAAALLLLSLPAMYAGQADAVGWLGLVGHALLATGLLLLVVVAAPSLVYPSAGGLGEHPIVFGLGISLALGLLLTGIATLQADVYPRAAAIAILAATAGFFFVFFVAEFLPPAAGQIGSAVFGSLLAIGLAWIGIAMWLVDVS